MPDLPVLGLLAFAAILNAVLLGVALLWRARRSPLRWISGMLLGGAWLLAVYTLEHYDQLWIRGPIRISYDATALLVSCFLLEFVHFSLTSRRPHRSIYGPVVLHLVLALVLGDRFLAWFRIELLVLVQSVYTLAAAAMLLRTPGLRTRAVFSDADWKRAAAAIAFFLALHLAHLLRVLLGRRAGVDPAPALGIAAVTALLGVVLSRSRLVATPAPRPRQSGEEARALVVSLQGQMTESRLYTDPELDLARLAASVEASPANVSDALNRELGRNFYEFLTGFRVDEARRRLADPAHAHLSLEAIGADSGFRSRSSFYAAFKAATGETPGSFRRGGTG